MKGGTRPLGYTIIEVMIVLAVSGMMFVIAAVFVSGKQARTSFTSGSNEISAQLQAIATQVTDGQYSDVDFGCSYVSATSPLDIKDTGSQGTNSQCIFLGKFIHFQEGGDMTKYEVFSLAGNRLATELSKANPTAVISSTGKVDLTLQQKTAQLLDVKGVSVMPSAGGGPVTTTGIGFVQGLGTATGTAYESGNQLASLVYAPDLTAGATKPDATTAVTKLAYANSATVCITDGTRYATILFGKSSNDATSVNSGKLNAKLQVVKTC